jgi:hypothetical protein
MITLVDLLLSFMNPPGYVEIKNVIIIKNTIKDMLPYTEKFEKFAKKLSDLAPVIGDAGLPSFLGSVKSITIYKKAKTDRIIVNINDEPKYLVIYPPGSIL